MKPVPFSCPFGEHPVRTPRSGEGMVDATGLEPVPRLLQAGVAVAASVSAQTADTQRRTQKLAESSRETMSSVEGLREVIAAWPRLSPELRAAVLAVTRAVTM